MKNKEKHISVVIPVYGTPELIPELCKRLHRSLTEITEQYEIILVFDCSPDNGWETICNECKYDERVKGIHLSRNFGQHYAITAGLVHAMGKWVIVMDCDLQDQPEEIIKLYHKAMQGYDIIFAKRKKRQDSFLKCWSSKLFYSFFSYMTDSMQDASIANFGIYKKEVIESILSMKDHIRYFPTMAQWVGYRSTTLEVEHARRNMGESTYSLKKLFYLALDNIIVFSDKPLKLTIKLGMSVCLVTVLVASFYFIKYLTGSITITGYTSLILSIWFLSGMVIFIIGIIGTYLGKVFEQTKQRPTYIVSSTINIKLIT